MQITGVTADLGLAFVYMDILVVLWLEENAEKC